MDELWRAFNHLDSAMHTNQRQNVKSGGVMKPTNVQCCLCAEIATRQFPADYRHAYPVESRICFETRDFVVLPSVSPMTAGHVLVLPRIHVTRLADLRPGEHEQLRACTEHAVDRLRTRFSEPCYVFEHGVTTSGTACGIDHAHLHILPLSPNTIESIELRVEADFSVQARGSLGEMLATGTHEMRRCYLLHGTDLKSISLSFNDRIPSQYMRQLISAVCGRADWDWKLLFGSSEFRATQEAFR